MEGGAAVSWRPAWWSGAGLGLHVAAHHIPGKLPKEARMILFEFAIPLVALAVAGIGIALLRAGARRIDARRQTPVE